MFSNFPAGLDANNTNNGSNGKYAVAELFSNNTESAYPSVAYNTPPGGAINYTTTPVTSANYQNHLIGVQSVVIDALDRLWILDTGRAIDPKTNMLSYASYGGPKLVCVNLTTNEVVKTIVFADTVAYPASYLNDVRFDLRDNLSGVNSSGVAYITDSSSEGRDGLIIVDLASGNAWRHLNADTRAHPELQFTPYVWGQPVYGYMAGEPKSWINFGADGIALSKDGSTLYFAPTSGRYMYGVATSLLRAKGALSEAKATAGVQSLGQKGVSDGFESDTNDFIYMGNAEQEAIVYYNPANASMATLVRDPRINWIDTRTFFTFCVSLLTIRSLTFLRFTQSQ